MAKKFNYEVVEFDFHTSVEEIRVEPFYTFGDVQFKIISKDGDSRLNVLILSDGKGGGALPLGFVTLDELKGRIGAEDLNLPIYHSAYSLIKETIKDSDVSPYLYGEAGTGKNIICEQLAEDLGLKFYTQNSVQTKFDMIGYTNADGEYVPTPFYEAFVNGGLFFLDEMDNSDAAAIKSLNQAIGSRYYSFPKIGMVKAHENFRCIAAGNTTGRGANDYVSNVIDPSTLNRFRFIRVDYDERIELRVANGNKELVEFFHKVRESSKQAGYYLVASYRGLKGITKFERSETIPNLLDQFLTQGMAADEINSIMGQMEPEFLKNNKYAKALKTLAENL